MLFSSSVRDPIYGTIPITLIEQEIMKLPILSRLRHIKQLGLAYLAFSGANHTRFEHSVGTMHIAYLIGQSIGLRDSDLQAVRLAALVHDVGHPPYSHSVEFAFRLSNFDQKFSHEEFTYKKVCNNEELANILKREIPLLHQEDIAKLATGKHEDKILSRIINGPLDADKIDYILRDNYHCGFPVALDISAITEIFSANRERGIMLKLAGLSFAEQLFIGRYHLITKIHHDQTNRLVNYLLALAINEALENSNKSNGKNKVVEMMFDTWTDVDLMNFLKEKSETYFPRLNDFMLGKESLKEVANFGYDELSPFARYNAYVLSENLNYLLSVSKKLSNKLKGKQVYLDTYTAKPPETTLSVDVQPPVLLIDAALTKGAVDASLEKVHFAIYSFKKLTKDDINMVEVIEEYRKKLDDIFTVEKAESMAKCYATDEESFKAFYLRRLVEILTNDETIEVRNSVRIDSDVILIILQAIYTSFLEEFQKRVLVDSLSQLVNIYLDVLSNNVLTDQQGRLIKPYNILPTASGYELPTNFMIDIERLERFGLVYKVTRTIKAREKYRVKYQFRIMGWGRGYYQKNLAFVTELCSLYSKLKSYFDKQISQNKEEYDSFFALREKGEVDREAERKLEDASKKLPIRITM